MCSPVVSVVVKDHWVWWVYIVPNHWLLLTGCGEGNLAQIAAAIGVDDLEATAGPVY